MKIIETPNGKIKVDCLSCGNLFEIEDFRQNFLSEVLQKYYENHRQCPHCLEKEEKKDREEKKIRAQEEFEKKIPKLIEEAGIERLYSRDRITGELFKVPPCRYAAEWIYRHRNENLLISGVTGSGKSTSASFIACQLIYAGKKVGYYNLRKLLTKWRIAKTSDYTAAIEKMLQEIFSMDLFIIDEVVGKYKVSESGQELLFEILEAVNSGACRAKIWMLGNFYEGSIEKIFADPEPVRRRIQENFSCVYLDPDREKVTPILAWGAKK